MFAQEVRDLQPTDERKCRGVLTTVGDFDQFALRVADVIFEVVTLPHLDSEKIVVVPLTLSARCVLSGERFGYLLKVMERMRRLGVELI